MIFWIGYLNLGTEHVSAVLRFGRALSYAECFILRGRASNREGQ
jgi:hypothetical protein